MLNCHLPSLSAICLGLVYHYILEYPQRVPKSLIFAFKTLNASPPKADYLVTIYPSTYLIH